MRSCDSHWDAASSQASAQGMKATATEVLPLLQAIRASKVQACQAFEICSDSDGTSSRQTRTNSADLLESCDGHLLSKQFRA